MKALRARLATVEAAHGGITRPLPSITLCFVSPNLGAVSAARMPGGGAPCIWLRRGGDEGESDFLARLQAMKHAPP